VPGALEAGDREQARELVAAALRANPDSARARSLARALAGAPGAQPEGSSSRAP